ncbi:hypothetical protein PIROE2DRAFT_18200 [Piromyces sp. E2]|nr:hypothetical protein PIROE2DRAFT_18200 [Piromyces sp. E2]|eukprot:OUM56968.1 hypothetical protein PIROE2DRAFT_18200 [Piromyces sp. E2]
MVYENIETLNSIYLRRKHKIVINNKKNLNEFFTLNIEKAIENSDYFSSSSSSQYLVRVKRCLLLKCILTVNNEIDVEFENGKLISDVPIKDTVFLDNLSALMESETRKIRNKLNYAITLNENITSKGFYMDIDFVNNIALYDENEYENFINEKIKVLSVGSVDEFYLLMIRIMMSTKSFSNSDQSDLLSFFKNEKDYLKYLPESIVNKENLAYIVKCILDCYGNDPPTDVIIQKYDRRDVNDVLLLIEVLSKKKGYYGDEINQINCLDYLKKRLLLELIDHCENRYENFVRKRSIWKKIFDEINMNDFEKEYPKLIEEIKSIDKYNIFNSIYLRKHNKLILYGNADINLDILFQREIEKAIEEDNFLSTSNYCIKVKHCNLLNCILSIDDDREIEYENGKVISTKVIHNDLLMEHINTIMEKETEVIRYKLNRPLALNDNISKLGYCLDIDLMKIIALYDKNEMKEFNDFLIPNLQRFVGSAIDYHPTFPNIFTFNISSYSLYYYYCKWLYHLERSINNIYGIGSVPVSYKRNKKIISEIESEVDIFNWKAITVGDEKEFNHIIVELLHSTENYSTDDVNDLENFMKCDKNCLDYIPQSISNKCNLAHITKVMRHFYPLEKVVEKVSPLYTDVNDVLILTLILSNHSVPKLEEEIQTFII